MDVFEIICVVVLCAYIVMVHIMLIDAVWKLNTAKKALSQRPEAPNPACWSDPCSTELSQRSTQ